MTNAPEKPLAVIGLGSNLGMPLEQLRSARKALENLGDIKASSSLYKTEPVGGPEGQPPYLNAVVILKPFAAYDDPEQLLGALLTIELSQGRERRVRWEARTLDLDLLAFNDVVLNTPLLSLPHPRMLERSFVLAPLCEVFPSWQHPLTKETACEALQKLTFEGVERTDLRWDLASPLESDC